MFMLGAMGLYAGVDLLLLRCAQTLNAFKM